MLHLSHRLLAAIIIALAAALHEEIGVLRTRQRQPTRDYALLFARLCLIVVTVVAIIWLLDP